MTASGVIHGDCLLVLGRMAELGHKVDAVVTDPPYHFGSIVKRFAKSGGADRPESRVGAYARHSRGFMGKEWDGGDIAMRPETWAAVLRVLKPGGHLVAFGGTRTHHRVWCAIEDAGFEIRDTIMWVYGSGFPKSHDAGGGWGTALKPAWEPILLARKPLIGTVAENMQTHGVGALNIDGCRVETEGGSPSAARRESARNSGHAPTNPGMPDGSVRSAMVHRTSPERYMEPRSGEALGRWPANLVHDGSEEVLAAFPQAVGQIADASSSSSSRKTQNVYGDMKRGNGREGEPSSDSENEGAVGFKMKPGARRGDIGSAARFFYCAKASAKDRCGSKHPTVKPLALMRHLVRLVTPAGGIILDPFAGSGTTGQAAKEEGFRAILIEKEEAYVADIRKRLAA